MSARSVAVVMLAALAVLIGVDIWLATDGVTGNTFSELIAAASWRLSVIPVGVGVLAGHWFWPGRRLPGSSLGTAAGLLAVGVGCLALNIWIRQQGFELWPIVWAAPGLLAGRYLWGMA